MSTNMVEVQSVTKRFKSLTALDNVSVQWAEHPPLMILDEPMNGLDKHGVQEIRTLLRQLCDKEGVTILMSSHYAEDIEALCDTVCEMDGGVLTQIRGFD